MSDTASRARFLEHAGKRVILLDFSGITDPEEGLAEVEKARRFIAGQKPDGTHLTLTDVTRTRYDRRIVEAFKAFTAHNRPYVRAAAVVSDSTLHRASISMIALFSKRKIHTCATREEGLAWLAAQ